MHFIRALSEKRLDCAMRFLHELDLTKYYRNNSLLTYIVLIDIPNLLEIDSYNLMKESSILKVKPIILKIFT